MRVLFLLLLMATPAWAQFDAAMLHGKGGAGIYLGLTDAVGSAPTHYWGYRALSTAEATAATALMFNAIRTSDSHTCDIKVATNGGPGVTANCSTGGDDGESFATWIGAGAWHTVTLYDRGSGTACNLTQSTDGDRPTWSGSTVGANFNGSSQFLSCALGAISDPQTWLTATYPTGGGSAGYAIFAHLDNTSTSWTGRSLLWCGATGGSCTVNTLLLYSVNSNSFSSGSTQTLSSGAIGAVAGLFTSTTSRVVYVTASAGSSDTTSESPTSENELTIGARTLSSGQSNYYNGLIYEIGVWGSALSGTNITAACHNQYLYGWSASSC